MKRGDLPESGTSHSITGIAFGPVKLLKSWFFLIYWLNGSKQFVTYWLLTRWLAMILIGVKFHIFLGAFPFLFQHQQFSRICLHFSRAFWSTKMEVGSQLIIIQNFPGPLISWFPYQRPVYKVLANILKTFTKASVKIP